jgi:predicted transglutaminase-like cysteine proteinase
MRSLALLLFLAACTPDRELLGTVNTQVNAIHYPGPYPCQQYVKEKHRRLLANGVPEDDMKVLYGVTYGFKPHVVLEAEGYILDNRYPDISEKPRILVWDKAPASVIEWAQVK